MDTAIGQHGENLTIWTFISRLNQLEEFLPLQGFAHLLCSDLTTSERNNLELGKLWYIDLAETESVVPAWGREAGSESVWTWSSSSSGAGERRISLEAQSGQPPGTSWTRNSTELSSWCSCSWCLDKQDLTDWSHHTTTSTVTLTLWLVSVMEGLKKKGNICLGAPKQEDFHCDTLPSPLYFFCEGGGFIL